MATSVAPPDLPAFEFPGVKALGEPQGTNAATQLTAVSEKLRGVGALAAVERLKEVDRAAQEVDFPTLERIAAPERAIEEMGEAGLSAVRRLVGYRNAMALAPLLFTWLLLAWASLEYHQQLAANPGLVQQPFLLLWEQRFGGQAILTFSGTALIDCLLLLVVLILTLRAHRAETALADAQNAFAGEVDTAMNALRAAVGHRTITQPMTAEEWVVAAQRILSDTQQILAEAVRETKAVAEANREVTESAKLALQAIQAEGQQYIGTLATETRQTLTSVRTENSQFIERTAQEATGLLTQAGEANQRLIDQRMAPLAEQFRATLEDFRQHHETYRESATALVQAVGELNRATGKLGDSAGTYTTIAHSIDEHLQGIEGTQTAFITRVTDSADSMRTTSQAMRELTEVLREDLRRDLKHMTLNVVEASDRLATVQAGLGSASTALTTSTSAMNSAAGELERAATTLSHSAIRRRLWPWRRRSPKAGTP